MNDIIEKAKKLLALKERASTPGEAQAAAFALTKLLDKHRISMTELEIAGKATAESILVDRNNPLIEFVKLPNWKRALITAFCVHYGVAWWRLKTGVGYTKNWKRKYECGIYLCGRSSDMQMVRYMYAWISSEAGRLSESECTGNGRRHTNSWLAGFADGIAAQLTKAREKVSDNAHTHDAGLVLHRRLDDSIKTMEESIKPTIGTFSHYRADASAHNAGRERGQAHHLGESLDSGSRRSLPEASGD